MTKAEQQAYNRAYYLANRERILAQVNAYAAANRDAVRRRQRKAPSYTAEAQHERYVRWYAANRERAIAKAREWKRANPLKVQVYTRDYASRKAQAVGRFFARDFVRLQRRLSGLCGYCGLRRGSTIDHIIPLSRGGTNYIGNIMPACGPCNYSKGGRTLSEWRRR